MKSLLLRLRQYIKLLPQKIWFLPSILTFGFLLLSLLLISLRYTDAIKTIDQQLTFLALSSVDTSRSILSTLTGGLISLVVFSFSMVMVVLNQATAQFSPRLLPGLISKRQHQFILGFYLGAIIYNLSVMARIGPSGLENSVPIVAVLLAIIFGISSLILFISFIDAISNAVRIDTILDDLYTSTNQSIKNARALDQERGDSIELPREAEQWAVVAAQRSGYFMGLDISNTLAYCEELEIDITVSVFKGEFLLQGDPLLCVSKQLEDKQIEDLLTHFRIAISEDIQADYLHGMNQMTEIAVKAMSPGINDPATAISAIDYQGALLHTYLEQQEQRCFLSQQKEARIWTKPHPFAQILFQIFAPLRTYCTADVLVTRKIIFTLQQLKKVKNISSKKRQLLQTEVEKTKSDARERILNAADRAVIEQL